MAATALDLGPELLLLTLFGAASVIGGMVTALKSRWGWLGLGLVTGGLIWPLTALVIAKPDSPWARSFYGPPKLTRARRRFPAAKPPPPVARG
jgi:hypothetical protein